jgi:hypothetical protein
MAMKGIAIENWPVPKKAAMCAWLWKRYGPQDETTWYRETDYGTETLIMDEKIYTLCMLSGHDY